MVELVQDQGSEYDTHSLDAAAQHAIQLVAVALLQLHAKTSVGPHASSMRKHICHWNCFTKTFSGGHGPSCPLVRSFQWFPTMRLCKVTIWISSGRTR